MAMMKPHGGSCCGISHLYLEGANDPQAKIKAAKKHDWLDLANTGQAIYCYPSVGKEKGMPPSMETRYQALAYTEDRPQETRAERAKALIDGMETNGRKGGIIEVVVTASQKTRWHPLLIEWGFVETVTALNTNSNNKITVYLLAY